MKQTIFLRTKQQQQAAINSILATPLDKDKPVTIRITDYKRNLDQNAKFHAMLADIARQVQWCGKWLKPEQWKVLLISGHAVATKQEADVLPGLEGEYVNIRESSAQMSVKRMASLIEYTTAWAIGQGVRFTDRRYEWHYSDEVLPTSSAKTANTYQRNAPEIKPSQSPKNLT